MGAAFSCMEENRNAHKIFLVNVKRKFYFGDLRFRVKRKLIAGKYIVRCGQSFECDNKTSCCIKGGAFLDQLKAIRSSKDSSLCSQLIRFACALFSRQIAGFKLEQQL